MKVNATVFYKGSSACFEITREEPGIYFADLLSYDGDQKLNPPGNITLIKGVRQWTGSFNDHLLLDQLGKVIEDCFH